VISLSASVLEGVTMAARIFCIRVLNSFKFQLILLKSSKDEIVSLCAILRFMINFF
jgi:hypothetical protein